MCDNLDMYKKMAIGYNEEDRSNDIKSSENELRDIEVNLELLRGIYSLIL